MYKVLIVKRYIIFLPLKLFGNEHNEVFPPYCKLPHRLNVQKFSIAFYYPPIVTPLFSVIAILQYDLRYTQMCNPIIITKVRKNVRFDPVALPYMDDNMWRYWVKSQGRGATRS